MAVSKQDWKDFQSEVWLAGERKSTFDELMQSYDGLFKAVHGLDVTEFLAFTESGGRLKTAADQAESAASEALATIQALRLDGGQRRFANKNAVATSDAAIDAVSQYHHTLAILARDLVRGLYFDHKAVAEDPKAMASIRSGSFVQKAEDARTTVTASNGDADKEVAALAAIAKIGIV